jgi:hypothetical protein
MAELTYGSGGTFFHENNNLESGFHDLLSNLSPLYILAFSLTDARSKGGYHRSKMQVTRSGLAVVAFQGYFVGEEQRTKGKPIIRTVPRRINRGDLPCARLGKLGADALRQYRRYSQIYLVSVRCG